MTKNIIHLGGMAIIGPLDVEAIERERKGRRRIA